MTTEHSHKEVKKKARSSGFNYIMYVIVAILGGIFVTANVFASQVVHPLYFSFITEDRAAVTQVLRRVRFTSLYPELFAMQEQIYGRTLDDDVNKEVKQRAGDITILERYLAVNPNARDILYNLALLYKENGNSQKADEYLKRAQEVDPEIGQK
jgi:tetratricopeptide (TPR) repeat protein